MLKNLFIYSLLSLTLYSSLAVSDVYQTKYDFERDANLLKSKHQKRGVYAFLFSSTPQLNINTNDVIELTTIERQHGGFALSNDKGVIIPSDGIYLLTFRVLPSSQTVIGLNSNIRGILNSSVVANQSSSTPISGQAILNLFENEIISIRNLKLGNTFTTLSSIGAMAPSLPVELTIVKIAED